jgi:hypothetical protein
MSEYIIEFLWLIGWLIACGFHSSACEIAGEEKKLSAFLVLFLFWPHYIGYSLDKK